MKNALKEMLPTSNGGMFAVVLSALLGSLIAIIIGLSSNILEHASTVIELIFNAILAIFASIFAVYSILLAFLNDGYLKRLSTMRYANKSSTLKKSMAYFESVLFIYFIAVGVVGVSLLLVNSLDSDFVLPLPEMANIVFAVVLLDILLTFAIRVIYELKSMIFNTILLFRYSIADKLVDFAKEEIEKDKDANDGN